MEILYSDRFKKQYARVRKPVQAAVKQRIAIFEEQPFHPLLHNHQLVGMYVGHRSINITGDWRAVYRETRDALGKTVITFVTLGTHSQLYR